MNLDYVGIGETFAGIPRVSGDEPVVTPILDYLIQYSPRERG